MAEMDEGTLKAILAAQITGSVGNQGSAIVQRRLKAERYYNGELFGNEESGRSRVVSRDVAEVVDSLMPSLMKVFFSGEEIGEFDPRISYGMDPNEIERRQQCAEQATDYCNWVWRSLNCAYEECYAWFKDALKFKNGVIKVWWDETPHITTERYQGLSDLELEAIVQDKSLKIGDQVDYPDPDVPPPTLGSDGQPEPMLDQSGEPLPEPMLHDVVVKRTNIEGSVRVSCVALDEFLINHRAVKLEKCPFTAHRYQQTISELTERFPEKKAIIETLATDEGEWNQERIERFRKEDEIPWRDASNLDPTMRLAWVCESWIRVDFDGDGIAEMRFIISAGTGEGADVILQNDEADDNQFADLTPDIESHVFWGRSAADQTEDIQLIKSTLLRGVLDTIYNANSPQMAVDDTKVNLDDLLTRRVAGIVRVKGNPSAAMAPVPTLPVAAEALQGLAVMDSMREQRTGIRRFSAGPGADAIDNAYTQTATGANMVHDSSQERIELIARNFAERGVKRVMRLILKLEAKHRKQPRLVKLRDTWVPIDPREWDTEMDMTVTVGLGTGNRQRQMQGIMALMNVDKEIIGLQQGMNGPLLYPQHIYAKLKKACEYLDLRSVTPYYADPTAQSPQGQQPPQPGMQHPEQQRAQADAQAKLQMVQVESQARMAEVQAKERGRMAEIQAGAQAKMAENSARERMRPMELAAESQQSEKKAWIAALAQVESARIAAKADMGTNVMEIMLKNAAGAYAPPDPPQGTPDAGNGAPT